LLAGALVAAAVAVPAHAATRAATGRAVIITPLSLVNTAPLSFGALSSGGSAGTATVSITGVRTTTGGVTPLAGTVSAASFTGLTDFFPFLIVVSNPPASITLTRVGGGATMTVDNFAVEGGTGLRLVATNSLFTFRVGGTLHVGANQAQGVYNGTFNMTVNYF
jgi:hypothetical protein